MFKNSKGIAISKRFLIPLLFVVLIFTSIGMNIDDVCAHDLNQSVSGIESGLNVEDKLENSQENVLTSNMENSKIVGKSNDDDILTRSISLNGGTFEDIRNAIRDANAGDTIKLSGTFNAEKAFDQIRISKELHFTSDTQATLNGKGLTHIFVVDGDAEGSSFKNLKLINGYRTSVGAAMHIYAKNVVVKNCVFENNQAVHGGAIYTSYTALGAENLRIENCRFIKNYAIKNAGAVGAYSNNTKILNCTFDSNYVYNPIDEYIPYGGALQVGLDDVVSIALVKDCKFLNNHVDSNGSDAHGGAGCVRDGTSYVNCLFVNNSAAQGGALTFHASGLIKNCTFYNNSALLYGGALSTGFLYDGIMNLKVEDSVFEGNTAPLGGAVQLIGKNIQIKDSTFNNNYASENGGAVNIEAETVSVFTSSFNDNVANVDGGAIFINGKTTLIKDSSFISNDALPDINKLDDGLGGAIYINSTQADVENNQFYYNTARNGSAIYYGKEGRDLKLVNNTLYQNQAWVYRLPIYAEDIYYGQTENISSIIHGGNNIAKYGDLAVSNAIYNAAESRFLEIDGETPVYGATTSGHLYQDDREYNMNILLTVKYQDGSVVYNKTLNSDTFGEVKDSLNNLKAGKYYVTATHFEDTYYKGITNTTSFIVTDQVDNKIKKLSKSSSNDDEINYGDVVIWTLNITNNGPSNATNVVVRDILPDGLVYIEDDRNGAYDPVTGTLNIPFLEVGEVYIINIKTSVKKTGEIVNNANVTSKEYDYDLTNNHDDSKINVNPACDLAVSKTANVTTLNLGELVKWTVTVRNNGPDVATGVVVSDVLPRSLIWVSDSGSGSYNHNTGAWNIGNLNKGASKTLTITTRVNATGTIVNSVSVSGNEFDIDESNNHANKSVNVKSACDLGIVKLVNPSVVNYTGVVKWTLVVTNYGPDAASGVKISDALPGGFVYINSTVPYVNGEFYIGNLAVGRSVSVDVYTRANITGTFVNVASVKGNEYDQNPNNNRAEKSVTVKPASDLAIDKSVDIKSPNFGDLVKWTVTVRNNGPDVATGVVVSDVLPRSLIWVSDSGAGSYNHNTGVWNVGSLNKGASKTLTITTRVNATGSIVNLVSGTGNEFDVDKSNNQANETVNVPKASDLGIVKLVNPSVVNYTDVVKWTLVVSNYGPDAASGVRISDALPGGFVYINSTVPYVNGEFNIGNLAVGKSISVDVYTRANITGTFVNVATVKGNEYDQNPNNNRADKSVTVKPASDLAVSKTANVTTLNLGDLVKWTVTVRNKGPDVATGVVVSDVLPRSLIWVSDSGAGSYNHNAGVWNVGSLNKGASKTLTITTRVNATGSIVNLVSVTGNEFDVDKSNNQANKSVTVKPACDLGIVKLVDSGVVNYTDVVKWTLVVSNYGPDAASGVRISDALPGGFVYINSTVPYVNGEFYIGNLAVGRSVSVDVYTRANITGTFVNVASVKGNEYDQNPKNNQANISVTVKPASDLIVVKKVNESNPNFQDLVKWTLTVTNNGPDVATGVVVSDVLPRSLIWVSDSGAGSYNHNSGVWNVGSINNGASKTLTITTRVNGTGVFVNNVSVTGNEFDWNKSNNRGNETINVPKASDLGIVKLVDSGVVNYTDVVKWTLVVSNYGPDAASGVRVSDALPGGFVYINSTVPYVNGEFYIGNLAVGRSVSVDVYTRANITGTFVNVASVKGNEYDQNPKNNHANISVTVMPASDLIVVKRVSESNPNFLDLVKWTLTVTNNGPDGATGVVVSDVLPRSLIWVSDSGAGSYNHNTGVWNVGSINNGASKTLTITTRVNGTGVFVNNVSVTGNEFDWNKSNNRGNETINVSKAADLEVIKLANQSFVNYRQFIKWTIIVTNNGPDKATGVTVDDILPEGLELVEYNATKGFYDNGIWVVCCLEKGETQSLDLICFVNKTGVLTNNAVINGTEYDHNQSNNYAEASVAVPKSSDLSVIKTVDNDYPDFGDIIRWSIVVTNNGPDDADDIYVMDLIPEGLILLDATCTAGNYYEDMWAIDRLDNGCSETLILRCLVKTLADRTNTAEVMPSQYDWNESNNKDSASISVNPIADVAITKLINVTQANYLDLIKWTLLVNNYGPNDASNVMVSDVIPNGLEVVSVIGGEFEDSIWDIGDLANGEYRKLEIICKIKATGSFKNFANVWGSETDPDLYNNDDQCDLYVPPASDLSITKTVSKYSYSVGDVVKYSVKLLNKGPDRAENLEVKEVMDDNLLLKSFYASAGDFDKVNDVWSLDLLDAGESAYLTLQAIAQKAGTAKNKVSASSDNYDPDLSNNDDSVSINISKKDEPEKNAYKIPNNHSNSELKEYSDSILEKHVSGNPFMVLVLLFVFTLGAVYGKNILKKR